MLIRKSAVLVVLTLLLSSCSSYRAYNRGEECGQSIKSYTKLVRWNEMEKAVLSLVAAEQRSAYSQLAETARRRGITMVDVRILAQECRAEQGSAEATVEFDYFFTADNRLKTITDRQQWVYQADQADEKVSGWKLTSPPPPFK